jgi:pimeloyl-ACP methyl ester carboxylesterase
MVVASAGLAAADRPVATEATAVRIPTAVGVFDGVAAGPMGGQEVLLLHGFPEFGIEWEHQLLALAAAGYRAVAPDQRGYSPGVRPGRIEEYQLDYPVADVLAIADALGWQRFDLVGHDWGAVVAWIAAAEHPERVRSLMAVSVPHPGAFAAALRTDPAQQGASTYMDFFRQPTPIPENKILSAGPPALAGVPAARSAEYFRRLTEPGALTAALNWYRANDFQGYERPVAVPTLFLAATDDPMVAVSGIEATSSWVTGKYQMEVLAGAGHTIPERAAAETSARLLDHLSSTTTPVTTSGVLGR